MDTLSTLGIKIDSNIKEEIKNLKDLEVQSAKTEQATVKYTNSTLILSQKLQAELNAEKQAHVATFASQLANMAKMKQAISEMEALNARYEKENAALHEQANAKKLESDRQTNLKRINELQYALQKEEQLVRDSNARKLADHKKTQAEYDKMFSSVSKHGLGSGAAATADNAAERAALQAKLADERKLRETAANARLAEEKRVAEAIRAMQAQIVATNVQIENNHNRQLQDILNRRRAMYANFTATMSSGTAPIQRSQVSAEMINRLSQYSRLQRETVQAVQQNEVAHGHLTRIMEKAAAITAAMIAYRTVSAIVGLPKDILDTNVEMERLRIQLEGVMGSALEAKLQFKELFELDIKTPFDIQGLTKTFVMLKNYGLEPTRDVMKSLTDAVAKLGGGTEQLIGIGRQLGQAWAKDKLQQIDMRPMIENGLPVISLLGRALNKTAGEILDMSKAGEIGRKEMQLLFEQMEKEAPNAAARNMNSLYGALSNVTTSWIKFSDALMQSNTEGFFKKMFMGWSEILDYFTDKIDSASESLRDMRKQLFDMQANANLQKMNPNLASASNDLNELTFGLLGTRSSTEEEIEALKDKIFNEQKLLEITKRLDAEKKTTAAQDLANDNATLAQEEKILKMKEQLLSLQEKYNASVGKSSNAAIDLQIEKVKNLLELKTKEYEVLLETNDANLKAGKVTAEQAYQIEMDYIDKIKQAKIVAIQEEKRLEDSKMKDTIQRHKTAYEAIRIIESSGGKKEAVNVSYKGDGTYNGTALGSGQTMVSTLLKPGYGVKPFAAAVEDDIKSFKENVGKLKEWVSKNEVGLDKFAEDYFNALVRHLGSVEAAVQAYGDHTPGYMAKFKKIYDDLSGQTVNRINDDKKIMELDTEMASVAMEAAEAQIKAKEKLTQANMEALAAKEAQQAKFIEMVDAEIDKYNQATMSESQYYKEKLRHTELAKGVTLSEDQVNTISGLHDSAQYVTEQKEAYDKARDALEKYNSSTNDLKENMSGMAEIAKTAFDGQLAGISALTGAMDAMVTSIEKNIKGFETLANERKKIEEFKPDVKKSSFMEDMKLQNDARNKNEAEYKALQLDTFNAGIDGIRQMAAATANMYEKNSSEAKAFNLIVLAGLAAKAAAAILTQGTGDPYTAFARIAAMAALVAGIMQTAGAGGFSFSGGSASKPPETSSGIGTTLGDIKAPSKSINNIIDTLKEIQAENYPELRGINAGVAALAGGITNVVTKMFQTGGLSDPLLKMVSKINVQLGNTGKIVNFDPILNFLLKGIFGTTSSKIVGGGITTNPFQFGGQLTGSQYSTIATTNKSWFSSKTKYSTVMSDLNEQVEKALSDVFNSMGDTMLKVAGELGKIIGTDLGQRVKDYVIPAMNIELRGLTGEEASKKLNEVISAALDNMAGAVFGDIVGQYQKLGEGMLETAIRIVAEVAVVQDALGKSGLKITGDIIAISDELVQAAGGLKEFQAQFNNYFEKFYSDEEKQFYLQKTLTMQLKEVNITLPETREGYRKLLEGLNLNNEADRARYSMLLKLASAADAYYSTIQAKADKEKELANQKYQLEIQLMELAGKSAEALAAKRKLELEAMDKTLRWLQKAVWKISDLQDNVNKAMGDVERAIEKARADSQKALNDAVSAATKALSNVQSIVDKLAATRKALTTSFDNPASIKQQRESAMAYLQEVLRQVRGGKGIDEFAGIDKSLSALGKPSQDLYKSFAEYAMAQARAAAVIKELEKHGKKQISDAQKQIDLITKTNSKLKNLNDAIKDMLKQNEINKKVLKEIANAEKQLNALKGINTSVLSIKDAIAKLAEALKIKKEKEDLIPKIKEAREKEAKAKSIWEDKLEKEKAAKQAYDDAIGNARSLADQAKQARQRSNELQSWQPAPTTWQAGQSGNALWEEILANFNKEHLARFGKVMNRPWDADADAQAAYARLKEQYENAARKRAADADAEARRLENLARNAALLIAKKKSEWEASKAATLIAHAAYMVAKSYADALWKEFNKPKVIPKPVPKPKPKTIKLSATESNSVNSTTQSNEQFMIEMRALAQEIRQMNQVNTQIYINSKKSADALNNMTTDGYSMNVTVVA